jgi:hypothetical protein
MASKPTKTDKKQGARSSNSRSSPRLLRYEDGQIALLETGARKKIILLVRRPNRHATRLSRDD